MRTPRQACLATTLIALAAMITSTACDSMPAGSAIPGVNGLNGANGADGTDGMDGKDGANGINGQPGMDGKDGASGNLGPAGSQGPKGDPGPNGAQGSVGPQGPPGPVDSTVPPSPENLHITTKGDMSYLLRWDLQVSPVAVQYIIIYGSNEPIATRDPSLIEAVVPGAARSVSVDMFHGSGMRYFRATAVSYTGVESNLSIEQRVDTRSRLAFVADIDTDNVFELYVTSMRPNEAPQRVGVTNGGNVSDFRWSPNGCCIAYRTDADTAGRQEMFVAQQAANGNWSTTKINGNITGNGSVAPVFAWSPDGKRLAFVADLDGNGGFDLFVADIATGNAPSIISGAPLGKVNPGTKILWSPDGRQILFRADQIAGNAGDELYIADGGPNPASAQARRISGDPTVGTGGGVLQFSWSPDGKFAAYVGEFDHVNARDLYVVRTASGGPARVTGDLPVGNTGVQQINSFSMNSFTNHAWSPDGKRIAFNGDREDLTDRLWVVDVTASTNPVLVSGSLTVNELTSAARTIRADANFAWSPDGSLLAFASGTDLYVTSATGVGSPFQVAFGLTSFIWSPDGDRMAINAKSIPANKDNLFVADLSSGAEPINVTGTPGSGGNVTDDMVWSPDGSRIIMLGDWFSNGIVELLIVTPGGTTIGGGTGTQQPVRVIPGGFVDGNRDVQGGKFALSPLAFDKE